MKKYLNAKIIESQKLVEHNLMMNLGEPFNCIM